MRISDWSSDVCSSDLLDRQLHRGAFERQRGHGAGNAVEFEQDAARLHARGPEFRRTLALTHTDFGRLRRHGDVGEDANPQTALTLAIGRASCRERVCQYV